MSLLNVKHLQKIYLTRFSSQKVEALKDVSFDVEEGEISPLWVKWKWKNNTLKYSCFIR